MSAAGWDDPKAFIMKQVKEIIVTPYVHICNLSLMTSIFPMNCKLQMWSPCFKSEDDMVSSNYRPVSVLAINISILLDWYMISLSIFSMITNYCWGLDFKDMNPPGLL